MENDVWTFRLVGVLPITFVIDEVGWLATSIDVKDGKDAGCDDDAADPIRTASS